MVPKPTMNEEEMNKKNFASHIIFDNEKEAKIFIQRLMDIVKDHLYNEKSE